MITTTWADLEREARNSPILYWGVLAYEQGRATREEVAIVMAVHLAVALRETQAALAEQIANAPKPAPAVDYGRIDFPMTCFGRDPRRTHHWRRRRDGRECVDCGKVEHLEHSDRTDCT